MENGIDALNKIKGTRNCFLEMQKLSKKIFDETIAKINELKHYHEQLTSNEVLLQEKKSTFLTLEKTNRLLDERVVILEKILHDKRQCIAEQEALLKKDQEDILSERSLYCDCVYQYICNEDPHKPEPLMCNKNNFISKEFDDLNKQIQNCENELVALNEKMLKTELARKELQSIEKTQKQEKLKYQQLLDDRKETLKNLMQQVKHLKFNRRKYELSCTIENLYQQNSNQNFPSSKNNSNGEISNYFNYSTNADNSKYFEALNKIRKLRTVNKNETNQEEFTENMVKRSKVSEKLLPLIKEIPSSMRDSCKFSENYDIVENSRRKFTPKKPMFSQKFV